MNYSIKDVFEKHNPNEWEDFWLIVGNFIDNFKYYPNYSRLMDEPDYKEPIMATVLAGIVEYLANKYQMKIPSWVFKRKYHLKEPLFLGGFKNEYNIFLLRETSLEFKVRNIFVSQNFLERC